MPDNRPEKCTRALPHVRVGESLETALMRLAARENGAIQRGTFEDSRFTVDGSDTGHGGLGE